MKDAKATAFKFLAAFFLALLPGISCSSDLPANNNTALAGLLLYYANTFQDICGPDVSDFALIQPSMAGRLQAYLQYKASLGSTSAATAQVFGTVFAGASKWEGGAIAPNGKIYGARIGNVSFLEIDPATMATNLVGPAGNTGSGLVLLPSGSLLEIPHVNSSINPVLLDSTTGTVSTLSGVTGSVMCAGGVVAPNGKVYCTSQAGASGALEIDPTTGIVTVFGAAQLGVNYGGGAILGLNGKIYAPPFAGTAQMAEIDPATRTITQFGPSIGMNSYVTGVLAPSGKIYVIPFNATSILEVDPSTRSVTTVGTTAGASNFVGAAVAPNGHIYFVPRNSATVIDFDPIARTLTSFGSGWGAGVAAFDGGVLGNNGKIYAFPLTGSGNNQQPLEIDTKSSGAFCPAVTRSAYFNKF